MRPARVYDIKVKGSNLYSKCYDVDKYGRRSNHDEWQPVKASISLESLKEAVFMWGFIESDKMGDDVSYRYYQCLA